MSRYCRRMPISTPSCGQNATGAGFKHVVVTRGNHIAGVVRVNIGLRRGVEAGL